MIFFVRSSSSTAFSIWQPKNARQTLGDKLVCISNLHHYLEMASAKLASPDSIDSLISPPAIGTIDVFSSCPPAICTSGFGVDTPASGYADFNPAGTPVIFMFTTGNPITWGFDQNGNYFANFGYGGAFGMDGPGGLIFTGGIPSGKAIAFGPSSNVSVDFWTVEQRAVCRR